MEIKPLENPICEKCKIYLPKAVYEWACFKCFTIYRAQGFRQNEKKWIEYLPYGSLKDLFIDIPMGISQWSNHGIKHGYDKFFGIKWPSDKELASHLLKMTKLK